MSDSLTLKIHSDPIPTDSAVQLRVVAGLHAGASVFLDMSITQKLTLGPGPEHDVVLRDAPGSAQLVCRESVWWWCEPEFERHLLVDSSWKWGSVHFSMLKQLAPWEIPSNWLFERMTVVDTFDDELSPEDQVLSSTQPDVQDMNDPQGPVFTAIPLGESVGYGLAQEVHMSSVSRSRRLTINVLLLIGVGVALVWWLSSRKAGPVVPVPVPVAALTPQTTFSNTADDLALLSHVVKERGFDDTVRVKMSQDGRPILLGVVADDDALDLLLSFVAKVTRRIVLNVITEPEFKLRVQALQKTAAPGIQLNPLPIGLLEVQQKSDIAPEWSDIQDWLRTELPEAVLVYLAEPKTVSSNTPLVSRTITQVKAGPKIKAVLGGDNPYVLLVNGEKWLPGGIYQGWNLLSVDADALVLQNSKGESLRLPR